MAAEKWGKYLVQLPAAAKGSRYVYHGYDTESGREVAIKVYKRIKGGQMESFIMKRFGSHRHLPLFYDYFIYNNYGHVVMEFIKGNRLNSPINDQPYGIADAVEITLHILDGLKHLHNHGILHFDVAPHNIIMSDNNPDTLKIIDFCSSIIRDPDGIWRSYRRGGTANFMPPEQKMSPIILNPSSDLYSAARICYWLINKTFPESDGFMPVINDNILCNILKKGMNKDMKKRYQSAEDFIKDLKSWQLK